MATITMAMMMMMIMMTTMIIDDIPLNFLKLFFSVLAYSDDYDCSDHQKPSFSLYDCAILHGPCGPLGANHNHYYPAVSFVQIENVPK